MAYFLNSSIEGLKATLNSIMSNIVVAIIILLFGLILGRIAGRLLLKVLKEIELNMIILKTTGIKASISELISKTTSYVIYFIFIIAALDKLNISSFIFNLLAGALIIIIIISILLGVKDFIPNMIAGVYIAQKKIIAEGENIKINGIEGKVKEIRLTNTIIINSKKDTLIVPNNTFIKTKIVKK